MQRGGTQPVRKFPSKSCPFRYGKDKILADARVLFERGLRDFCPPNQNLSPVKGTAGKNSCRWAVTSLSIGASGMSAVPTVCFSDIGLPRHVEILGANCRAHELLRTTRIYRN